MHTETCGSIWAFHSGDHATLKPPHGFTRLETAFGDIVIIQHPFEVVISGYIIRISSANVFTVDKFIVARTIGVHC